MRRWTIIFLGIIVPALLAGGGYYWLACRSSSRSLVHEVAGGYSTDEEPATLQEVLTSAHKSLDEIEHNVRDYSALIVKQELVDGHLVESVMFTKIRQKPFSVYLNFIARSNDGKDGSKSIRGREVIYVEGRNGGKLLAHTPGFLDLTVGKMALAPNSFLAMQGERYPITEIGLANLCRQLIKRGDAAGDAGQVKVKRFVHASVNKRPCTLLEIMYPVQDPKLWGYLARVFVDNQLRFPIRVEVHELPRDRDKRPRLVESYTYLDLKLNNGYSDADFDPKNPQYRFP